MLETTEKFIHKNASLLTPAEVTATTEAMQTLQLALTIKRKNLLPERIAALNKISRPYAERVMDEAVKRS